MTNQEMADTIRAQRLMGRKVYAGSGRKLGRVFDMIAERDGDELTVRALLVGSGSWLERFGWKEESSGKEVNWDEIESLSPVIRLRRKDRRQ